MKIFRKITIIAIVACLLGSLQGATIERRDIKEDIKLFGQEKYFEVECNFPYNNVLVLKVLMKKQLLVDNKKIEMPKKDGSIEPGGMFYYRDYRGEMVGHPYWESRFTAVDKNKNGLWEVGDYVIYTIPINVKYENGDLQSILELYEIPYLQIDFLDTGIILNLMQNEDYRGKFREWEKYQPISLYSHEVYEIRNRISYSGDIYKEKEDTIIKWANGEYEVQHNDKINEELKGAGRPY